MATAHCRPCIIGLMWKSTMRGRNFAAFVATTNQKRQWLLFIRIVDPA